MRERERESEGEREREREKQKRSVDKYDTIEIRRYRMAWLHKTLAPNTTHKLSRKCVIRLLVLGIRV